MEEKSSYSRGKYKQYKQVIPKTTLWNWNRKKQKTQTSSAISSEIPSEVTVPSEQQPESPPSTNNIENNNSNSTENHPTSTENLFTSKDADQLLYPNATVTISEFQFALLLLILTHYPTKEFLDDLLKLISNLLPRNHHVPPSIFLFNKLLKNTDAVYIDYCPSCFHIFGQDEIICPHHKDPPIYRYKGGKNDQHLETHYSYFLKFNFLSRFQQYLSTNWKLLQKRQDWIQPSSEVLRDIYDGDLYRQLSQPGSFLDNLNNFSFMWNTDGVQVFESTSKSMWPIFLTLNELPKSHRWKKENMFLAGVFFGEHKPDMNSFLKPFVGDITQLYETGVDIECSNQRINCKAVLLGGVFDALAKAIVLNMKQFSATSADCFSSGGCPCCHHPGKRLDQNKTVYPYSESTLAKDRTHQERVDMADAGSYLDETIKGGTILLKIPNFNVVNCIPVDAMHCCWEGVTAFFMNLWFDATYHNKPWSLRSLLPELDQDLKHFKISADYGRTFRSYSQHGKHWKAMEYKLFAFVVFPVWMKKHFNTEATRRFYDHFLLFVAAMSILHSKSISRTLLSTAHLLLVDFVKGVQEYYAEEFMTFNIHQCLHLTKYALLFGPLWTHDCFPFETFNAQLLKYMHGTRSMMEQLDWFSRIQQKLESLMTTKPSLQLSNSSTLKGLVRDKTFASEELHVLQAWARSHGLSALLIPSKFSTYSKVTVHNTFGNWTLHSIDHKLQNKLKTCDFAIKIASQNSYVYGVAQHFFQLRIQSQVRSMVAYLPLVPVESLGQTCFKVHKQAYNQFVCVFDVVGKIALIEFNSTLYVADVS